MKKILLTTLASAALAGLCHAQITLEPVSSISLGDPAEIFDGSAAEIVAYDADGQRAFVVNAYADAIDVYGIRDINEPEHLFSIDVSPWGAPNSVAVNPRKNRREIAVAVANSDDKTLPGKVVFFSTRGKYLGEAEAGSLPDMLTYDKTGKLVLVANEGEPSDDYSVDPEGSVTIVDVQRGPARAKARQVSFAGLNGMSLPGVRITGPAGTTVAQDLEPEFIAIAPNNQTAYVACQENNAIVVIDIKRGKVMDVFGLGLKDHSLPGNGLDPSNRDGGIAIANWPVMGLYMPDSMVAYESDGEFYLVTANEGDAREWGDYIDEARVGDMGEDGLGVLDPTLFPNADDLMKNANLGRIKFVTTEGDLDGDGDYDQIVTFGARSFSIWNTKGQLVFDSGDAFEQITAQLIPEGFNSDNGEGDSADSRSDDKGPEPEGLAIGKIKGRTYAFVGLERVGGIMVFDITQPAQSRFVTYVNNRDFSVEFDEDNLDNIVAAGDLGPEGLAFVPAHESPSRQPLLLVGNEVSGTFTIYAITEVGGKGKGPRSK